MSSIKNEKIGQLTKDRSLSVVLASDQPAIPVTVTSGGEAGDQTIAPAVLTIPFNTSTPGAQTLLANTDISKYTWIEIVYSSVGTGLALAAQYAPVSGGPYVSSTTSFGSGGNAPASSLGTTVNTIYFGPTRGNFFQLALSALTSGTVSGTVTLRAVAPPLVAITTSTSQAGNWTVSSTTLGTATAPTVSQVTAANTTTTLKASNTSRKSLLIYNGASTALLLKLGATASITSFTVRINAGAYYELPISPIYNGVVDGIWEGTPTGSANVTEIV